MERKVDFLRELGTIGVGHATIALSEILQGKLFRLEVPDVRILRFEEAASFIGGLDQVVAGVSIQISGDLSGHMAFILPVESAAVLVRLLTGSEDSTDEIFDELGRSALAEIGNIMITSYLNALSALTNFVLRPSIPGLAIDMAGAVWQSVLAGALIDDEVTLIRTDFSAEGIAVEGNIILLPEEDEFKKITRVLGLEEM
ncbi:MAG: CheY-P-specific phosphatase CheC [Firmicutes bacterium]|nr:CheY-P-specific phosphatase CheC [Bacillota bacterium]